MQRVAIGDGRPSELASGVAVGPGYLLVPFDRLDAVEEVDAVLLNVDCGLEVLAKECAWVRRTLWPVLGSVEVDCWNLMLRS